MFLGAFASFFSTGDPNKLKLTATNVPGLPALENGEQWVMGDAGFDAVKLDSLKKRCDFWKKKAAKAAI